MLGLQIQLYSFRISIKIIEETAPNVKVFVFIVRLSSQYYNISAWHRFASKVGFYIRFICHNYRFDEEKRSMRKQSASTVMSLKQEVELLKTKIRQSERNSEVG